MRASRWSPATRARLRPARSRACCCSIRAGVHVEWSTNEKVAFEIAAGAAWAGQRALCTMKMSGVNVAYDSITSIAYSGVVGGLVIYVADDPGVSAGMCEQDSRGFAVMSDLPMLDAASVEDAYRLTRSRLTCRSASARRSSSAWLRQSPPPLRRSRSTTTSARAPEERARAADPRHQPVHQGRLGDLHDPAPRRDRAAGAGRRAGPRARAELGCSSRRRAVASGSSPAASSLRTWMRRSRWPGPTGSIPQPCRC